MVECSSNDKYDKQENILGPYLGQTPPGNEAKLFAPGIISTGMNERDIAMTPDLKEIYYSVSVGNFTYSTIMFVKEMNGKWSEPEVASFADNMNYKFIEPFISPNGKKLYFVSDMPDSGKEKIDMNIWVTDRKGDGWSKPYSIDSSINSGLPEYYPSATTEGTLYFTRDNPDRTSSIFRSKIVNGIYNEPELLGPEVNAGRSRYNALISPDESFIIVPTYGMEDSFGATDYYISFRDVADNWRGPFNMGPQINSADPREWSLSFSPDNKYIFFMSSRNSQDYNVDLESADYKKFQEVYNRPRNGNTDIYWIDAAIIDTLYDQYVK